MTIYIQLFSSFEDVDIEDEDPEIEKQNNIIRKTFKVEPSTAILPPTKPIQLKITFFPLKALTFRHLPIFKCTFIDPKHKNVIDNFNLTASAKVYLSK